MIWCPNCEGDLEITSSETGEIETHYYECRGCGKSFERTIERTEYGTIEKDEIDEIDKSVY